MKFQFALQNAETIPQNAIVSAMLRSDSAAFAVAFFKLKKIMLLALTIAPMFAAAGWAFLYWIFGGGLGGAILIFIVLKMFGR